MLFLLRKSNQTEQNQGKVSKSSVTALFDKFKFIELIMQQKGRIVKWNILRMWNNDLRSLWNFLLVRKVKWNKSLTRRSAFHTPQAYFTCEANFTNPARDLFRWKETAFVLVDKSGFFSGAADRGRTGTLFRARDFKSLVSAYSTTAA